MGKPKCKTCNSCMDFVWVDNNRYLNCWLCQTWYTGQIGNLIQVDNPYLVTCPECNGEQTIQSCTTCRGSGRIDKRRLKNESGDDGTPAA